MAIIERIKKYFSKKHILQFYVDTGRRNAKGIRKFRYKYLIKDEWKDKKTNQGMTERRDLAKRFWKWQAKRLRRKTGLSKKSIKIIQVD